MIYLIIIIIVLCFYLYYENNFVSISKYKINNKKIPKEFNGYKIIQISDFHSSTSKVLNNKLVKNIKNIKPDIIVITGDLLDARRKNVKASVKMIKNIIEYAPIYYVSGNHEERCYKKNELLNEIIKLGVNVLDNKCININKENSSINLIGLSDARKYFKRNPFKVIKEEFKLVKYNKNKYTILLNHRPELFNIYVSNKIDLVFCGHAHGGQVRLPLLKGLFAPSQGVLPKYSKGVYEKRETTMVLSAGIGNSLFPFRINNRPDLVLVILNNEN